MADKVAVLKDGRLIQFAPPKLIYREPASKAVAEFVGLSTILEATVAGQDCIDIGFARLAAPTGQRSAGQKVFALMRPEHLVPDPAPGTLNRLDGRVSAQRYLGAVSRYDFMVEGASAPLLVESSQVAQEAVAISPEHIRLLDD